MPSIAHVLVAAGLIAACAAAAATVDNAALPAPVRVPAGHELRLWSIGKGEIRYACRQAGAGGRYAWVSGASTARLYDVYLREIGWSYAGPTWKSVDGSKVTGRALAVAPAGAGHLPLQLLRAGTASGQGTMQGVSYIQRLNTRGGAAPAQPCDARREGRERVVGYEADYVFYGRR
ncbi:DUF3455 domain-containing protein [Azohydromonas caseinilytica]|uniref:DUF3455 domain-containing protein n=1 Tax=Azohydromonas caseinilytica TaxID=2728836 RepID=A0A848F7J2_9BURK|nr:DUF3455 domain-containing protein [Azohydromonas caseinilytica]NML14031.1 DUF3455 domain-containing protein [Azohydromonas caseinilytica]